LRGDRNLCTATILDLSWLYATRYENEITERYENEITEI
jgi:hypothetical protein